MLVLLALTSQALLFKPSVEAVNHKAIRSRLNNTTERVEFQSGSQSEAATDERAEDETTASESSSNSEESSSNSEASSQLQNEDPSAILDTQQTTEAIPVDEAEAKAFQDEQRINDFVKALGALETLEHYQINYSLTDTKTEETVAEGNFIGNQTDGDLMGKITYHFPKSSPSQYDFEFISYRNFDLAYVKTFELLDSMAYFNQPHFKLDVHEKMADLHDVFVAIESSELNRVNLQRDPLKSLLMLPDLNRLSRITGESLYQVNDVFLLSLERLEIPEYLFRHSNNFGFDFQLGMKVLPAGETESHLDWSVTSEQRFELSEKDNSLNFKVAIDSELSDFMLPPVPEGSERNHENFARQMSLDNNVMLDKLTKVNVVYNVATQTYRISLVGIVEQIEFNLFSDETAGLETTEYRLDYVLKPIEREIPSLNEIRKMTAAEADYILEEFLTP